MRLPDSETDDRLLRRYLAGDGRAFDVLMERHENRVFAVSLRILRDREDALDATQETFVTVLRKAGRFQGRSAFSTWLYRVAVNTCYDLLRKKGRRATARLSPKHDPPDPSSADRLSSVEALPAIEDALARLPEAFRAAVILSDLEGLPLQEVAGILEVPLGTVKSRVFRGRRMLAAQLGNLSGARDYPKGNEHG